MLNWVAIFPEVSIVFMLIVSAFVLWLREKATPKTFFSLAKFGLIVALVATIILYNQSFLDGVYENFAYTTLFKILIYLAAWVNMGLAVKYFLAFNVSSFRFYTFILLSLLLLTMALSCANIGLLFGCVEVGFLLNYGLTLTDNDDENLAQSAKIWLAFSLIVSVITLLAVLGLVYLAHSWAVSDIAAFITASASDWKVYGCCAVILISILFKLGVAPFHFWAPDILGLTILPVSGYLAIVPVLAYAAVWLKIAAELMPGIYGDFSLLLSVFALFSVVVGSIGANTELNMRKILAYVRIFVLGIVFLMWKNFQLETVFSGFIFLLICMITLLGIYAVFYGLKEKGVYLVNLLSVSGVSESKPFLGAAFVFFLFSLLGFPPSLGFLGLLSIVHDLVNEQNFVAVALILVGVVILSAAFLKVIKSVYFDKKTTHFDRVDKGIYWMLFWILAVIVILMLNPKYLMNDIEVLLRALMQ